MGCFIADKLLQALVFFNFFRILPKGNKYSNPNAKDLLTENVAYIDTACYKGGK